MGNDEHIEKTEEQQSVLMRSSNFQANCSRGWRTGVNSQIHHVVPCNTVAMRHYDYPPGKTGYIEDCLWVAPWDINDGANLYGLPLKGQYRHSGGKAPSNLPCHNVDHPKYSGEVRDWLRDNVWNALNYKKKIHKVDVEKIVDTLKRGSKVHLRFLREYGRRSRGTRHSWAKRHDSNHIDVWFEPFSMSADPTPRNPPGARTKKFDRFF